jgi:hypothetical protein
MNSLVRRPLKVALAATIGVGALVANDQFPQIGAGFVSEAQAIIGRPLTPMSYAGVARRTTRRAYAAGAGVYGAPIVGAPVVYGAPVAVGGCYQVVDAYGQVFTRCR